MLFTSNFFFSLHRSSPIIIRIFALFRFVKATLHCKFFVYFILDRNFFFFLLFILKHYYFRLCLLFIFIISPMFLFCVDIFWFFLRTIFVFDIFFTCSVSLKNDAELFQILLSSAYLKFFNCKNKVIQTYPLKCN